MQLTEILAESARYLVSIELFQATHQGAYSKPISQMNYGLYFQVDDKLGQICITVELMP